MNKNLAIPEKYFSLPAHLKHEVADFIDFLSEKHRKSKLHPAKRVQKCERSKSFFGNAKGQIIVRENFDDPLD